MGTPEDSVSYWQNLAIAADQGNLYLDPEAASACSRACDDYVGKLFARQEKAKELANIKGWGDFSSGQAVRTLYAEKAVGGPNNMVDVLQGHIDVVREMQVVFQKFFVDTGAMDDANATEVGQQGPI